MKLGEEKIDLQLHEGKELPLFTVDLIGQDNIDFLKASRSDAITEEISTALRDPDLTPHDRAEYIASSPEYKEFRKESLRRAKAIVDVWKKDMNEITASIKETPPNVDQLFNRLIAVSNLYITSLDSSDTTIQNTHYNARVVDFCANIVQHFMTEVHLHIKDKRNSFKKRHNGFVIQKVSELTQRFLSNGFDMNPILSVIGQVFIFKEAIEENHTEFTKLLKGETYPDDLHDVNEALALEVDDLSQFRTIKLSEHNIGDNQALHFFRDDAEASEYVKLNTIAKARLLFRRDGEWQMPTTHPDNPQLIQHHPSKDAIEMHIDRMTGEFCFVTSSLPVRNILGDEQYEKLKYIVLNKLKDLLSDREEDIGVFEEDEDSEEAVLAVPEDEAPTEQVQENIRKEVEITVPDLPTPEKASRSDEELKKKLKGLKSKKVANILKNMLEYTPGGSHHRFYNKTGGWETVPLSHRTVSRHILLKALRKWDILEAFVEKL